MRIYDETKTLPMPRPKTVIIPARRPTASNGFAEATARPRAAAAAEEPEADWPGAGSQLRKHASANAGAALAGKPAGGLNAEKPDALMAIANTINIKATLDPGRFRKLSRDISGERFSFSVATANGLALKVTLGAKAAQKAHEAIEQDGPASISLMLTGRLGPNCTLLNPGLAVNPKPQKA